MLIPILLSVFIVSIISFAGAVTLAFQKNILDRWLKIIVAFAAGTLLAAAFFDLIPEAVHELGDGAFLYILGGIVGFFVLERFIFWHHCHTHTHDIKPYTYLNLLGDGAHNFLDGAIIAAAFLTDSGLGIVTTIAIGLHEIPQEIGDFAILVHGGMEKMKALMWNFVSALAAFGGALVMFFLGNSIENLIPVLIAVAGGGFTYIAVGDLFPEMQEEGNLKVLLIETVSMALGLLVIYWVTGLVVHAH